MTSKSSDRSEEPDALDEVSLAQQVRAVTGVLDVYRPVATLRALPAPIAVVAEIPGIVVEAITGALTGSPSNAVVIGSVDGHATIETSIATSAEGHSTRIAQHVADVLLDAAAAAGEPLATINLQLSRIS